MLYPLKFTPILKDKIWGGTKLKSMFGKESMSEKLGESWELSGYIDNDSIANNGFLAGNNLSELIEIYMGELVGDKIHDEFGLSFPLLFKLIDSNDNLSIQVHPGDEIAAERHNSYGKTEMWYIIDAEPQAELIMGFSEDCSRDAYLKALNNGQIEKLLQKVPVSKGDVFFIPSGLIHSIGKGIVLAEIQQSSDITYRIYDYNRTDEQKNKRELHTEEALDVIRFEAIKTPKTDYKSLLNEITPLVSCDYFTTNMLRFNQAITRNYATLDSFVTYMCLEGNFIIEYKSNKTFVNKGDTILIPACIDDLLLIPDNEAMLLEVYIGN